LFFLKCFDVPARNLHHIPASSSGHRDPGASPSAGEYRGVQPEDFEPVLAFVRPGTNLPPHDTLDLRGWHRLTEKTAAPLLDGAQFSTQRHHADNAISSFLSFHGDPLHFVIEVGRDLEGPALNSPGRAALAQITVWAAIAAREARIFSDSRELQRSHGLTVCPPNQPIGVEVFGRLYISGVMLTIPKSLPVNDCAVRDEGAFIQSAVTALDAFASGERSSQPMLAAVEYIASHAVTDAAVEKLSAAFEVAHLARRQRLGLRGPTRGLG
jgi:hypothetical protein